uniref:ENT domain-containing protein n=1 Tax=Pyramimonas obovata TaxID=1411642 RepID=A0A7S0WGB8_9CHLO|mmetsp:Transcript_2507/g.5209  ORF Transcript_2507/g.5209 Transcript_2507/m.5209 type:complete len:324 (+) Transcript_2507:296-1267(+)
MDYQYGRGGSGARGRGGDDVEAHIRQYNYDAYTAVVRAFSLGELSWAKDAVLTELRQHLDISGSDEAEIKMLVMRDEGIAQLRNGRLPGGSGKQSNKKQRMNPPAQPSPFTPAPKKPAPHPTPKAAAPPKSVKKPSGKDPSSHKKPTPGKLAPGGGAAVPKINELVGKRLKRHWGDDGWCEAVVSDHNAVTGEHCLVYEFNTPNESWEWCVLDDLSPNEVIYLPGPKVPIPQPAAQPAVTPVAASSKAKPSSSKKGGKSKAGGKAAADALLDADKLSMDLASAQSVDKVEKIKSTIQSREQEILAQLNALSSDSDSDEEASFP